MLALEVEFLTGISVAASPTRREEAEWPPHPDRLFQALVASWGRNDPPDDDERRALEWLETLDANGLAISAPNGHRRDVATVFVPPNDARTTGSLGDNLPKDFGAALRIIPEWRKNRQPRAFPAVVLPTDEPAVVRYVWQLDEEKMRDFRHHRNALSRLAQEVSYLGHSHSVVRVDLIEAVPTASTDSWIDGGETTMRLSYPGRFQELAERYKRSEQERRVIRPHPSLMTRIYQQPTTSFSITSFDADNATVFADAGGFVPTLAAFPVVAKRFRDALLKCAPSGNPIPALVSGHDVNGRPSEQTHISIVPLADVGWAHSLGRLMGLAVVWPRSVASADRRAALKIVASFLTKNGRKVGLLHFGENGSWCVALEPEPDRASLHFARYIRGARRWGTVLPAALDRHPKNKAGDELADIVTRACLNIGLPQAVVDGVDIEIHKYSAIKGAASVREVLQALPPDSPYRTKPFAHLVLTFPHPIRGPLIIGAGRFRGLGLCLPLDDETMS